MSDAATLGQAYVQIIPSMEGTKGRITNLLSGEMQSAGNQSGTTLGSSLVNGLKGFVTKAGVLASVGAVITQSLTSGADLEQQLGGIETLFGESADKMRDYASQAYKTAGVSAQQFMRQSTSFAASLLQSLDGDTGAAADYANRAVQDMADNANKFGTNISMIQSAYQGFAKQNYTMLDNLKLGYGGTKSEMQRLIQDASKLTDVQEELGVTVDANSMSFANIVNAISVMQKSMGVTGTTSKEAAETFSGSLGMMKAAAQDFLSALMMYGKDGVDITGPTQALLESLNTFFFKNLVPAIVRMVQAIPGVIQGAAQYLISSGADMIGDMIIGLVNAVPQFLQSIHTVLQQAIAYIREHLPEFLQKGQEFVANLAQGLIDNLPAAVEAMAQICADLVQLLAENGPQILIQGVQLVAQLAGGILRALPGMVSKLLAQIPGVIKSLFDGWGRAISSINWGQLGKDIINGIGGGIVSAVKGLVSVAVDACKSVVNGVKKFFGIHSPSKLMRDQIGAMLPEGMAEGIIATIPEATAAMDQMNAELMTSAEDISLNGQVQNDIAGTAAMASGAVYGTEPGRAVSYGGVTISINAADYNNAKEIAEAVKEILINDTEMELRGSMA